jgi:hypothetical protein
MPARLADIQRVAATFGLRIEQPRGGSHWRARSSDGKSFPIPAHNGLKEEISDIYIRKFCRFFGIDEAAFRAKL